MKTSRLLGACCAAVFSVITLPSHAALVGRDLDGNLTTAEAYYDTVAGLTWLADANAAVGSVYDTVYPGTGLMFWSDANAWAAGLDLDGIAGPDGWRLPGTLQPDASCANQYGGDSSGYNCTGSEMSNLFYNVLGGVAGTSISTSHNSNYDLFSNVQSGFYWSSTEYTPITYYDYAWGFSFDGGNQFFVSTCCATSETYVSYAWAVHSGDIGAATVPLPAAVWMFGGGLLGVMGVGRKRRC